MPLSKKRKPIALAKRIGRLATLPDKQVKIISLVRDPVAKTISQLFQTPEAFGTTHKDLLEMDVCSICNLLTKLKSENFHHPCQWFDREFFEFTGIDIYQNPFNHKFHRQVETFNQFDVLVLRTEDLCNEDLVLKYIKDFVHKHIRVERLITENTTIQKETGERYKEVKKSIKFPHDFVAQIYSSKYCRHFYTHAELDIFKRRWCSQEAEHEDRGVLLCQ